MKFIKITARGLVFLFEASISIISLMVQITFWLLTHPKVIPRVLVVVALIPLWIITMITWAIQIVHDKHLLKVWTGVIILGLALLGYGAVLQKTLPIELTVLFLITAIGVYYAPQTHKFFATIFYHLSCYMTYGSLTTPDLYGNNPSKPKEVNHAIKSG